VPSQDEIEFVKDYFVGKPPKLGEILWVKDFYGRPAQGEVIEVDPIPAGEDVIFGYLLPPGFMIQVKLLGKEFYVQGRFFEEMRSRPDTASPD